MKKSCHGCAFKMNNPSSAHIQCRFDWAQLGGEMPKGKDYGIQNGWYNFPWNYDPVWMDTECKNFKQK